MYDTKKLTALGKEIVRKYGIARIQAAEQQYCRVCSRSQICKLMPVTLQGKDCPYFNTSSLLPGIVNDYSEDRR